MALPPMPSPQRTTLGFNSLARKVFNSRRWVKYSRFINILGDFDRLPSPLLVFFQVARVGPPVLAVGRVQFHWTVCGRGHPFQQAIHLRFGFIFSEEYTRKTIMARKTSLRID